MSEIVVSHAVGEWVCQQMGATYNPDACVAIGRVDGDRVIGGVVYDDYNGSSICMHCAGEGGWLTKELLRAVFGYPFTQLKVKKVIGFVDSTNKAAMRLNEHLGFTLEAKVQDGTATGDLLIYTMTPEQCRFLGGRYGKYH